MLFKNCETLTDRCKSFLKATPEERQAEKERLETGASKVGEYDPSCALQLPEFRLMESAETGEKFADEQTRWANLSKDDGDYHIRNAMKNALTIVRTQMVACQNAQETASA